MPQLRPQDLQEGETISSATRDPYMMVDPNNLESLDSEAAASEGSESGAARDSEG